MKKRIFALLVVVALAVTATVLMTNAETPPDYAADLVWTDEANHMAVCPDCGVEVQWTPLTSNTSTDKNEDNVFVNDQNVHFYVSEDEVTINTCVPDPTGKEPSHPFFLYLYGSGDTIASHPTVCLHMNGNNLTVLNNIHVASGELNIMGTGTFSGTGTIANRGTVLNLHGWYSTAKLLGDVTLQSVAGSENKPSVTIDSGYPGTTRTHLTIDGATINNGMRQDASVVRMYSGTINGGLTITNNGYYSSANTNKYQTPCFYMSGGTINGRTTGDAVYQGDGGAVHMTEGAVFEVSGGTVNGCNVSGNGGAIYAKGATLSTVKSGTTTAVKPRSTRLFISGDAVINGGTAAGDGGAIYFTNGVYTGGAASLEGTDSAVEFGIVGTSKVTGGTATNGGNIAFTGGNLRIGNTAIIEEGYATNYGGNVWINGTSKDDGSGKTVVKTQAYMRLAYSNGTTQSTTETATIRNGKSAGNGGNIYTGQYSTVYVGVKGVVSGGKTDKNGGNIATSTNTVYIYGTVQDGIAKGSGGNIVVAGGGLAQIDGGLVTNGKAYYQGGNIQTNNGRVKLMNDGVISNGISNWVPEGEETKTQAGHGGNIAFFGGSTVGVTVESGKIIGGQALGDSAYGGNIYGYVSSGYPALIKINGGEVSGGYTEYYGGNIAISGGSTLTINGGTVKDNVKSADDKTAAWGGNIYATGDTTTVNIASGYVTGGKASKGGNIKLYSGADLNISGGEISGGNSTDAGGGIHADRAAASTALNSVITLTAGTVTNNTAGGYGGNIYADYSDININGGSVKNGVSSKIGGNIWCAQNGSVITMTAGEVSGGKAPTHDNIRLNYLAQMNMTGGVVYGTDGKVNTQGSAIGANNSTIRLGGTANVLRKDGQWGGLIEIVSTCGKIQVLNDWTGSAGFNISTGVVPANSYNYELPQYEGNFDYTNSTPSAALAQCGTYNAQTGVFTKSGNVNGNLYYGNSEGNPLVRSKNSDGTLWITAAKVITDEGEEWVFDANDALDDGAEVTLELFQEETELELKNNDLTLDVNGKDVYLSGDGKLTAIDSANDNYKDYGMIYVEAGANVDYDKDVTVTDEETGETKRYLAVVDNAGNISYHRVNVTLVSVGLKMNGDSLEELGYYYKALYEFDDVLKAQADRFGVATSLSKLPGADFALDSTAVWTEMETGDDDFAAGVVVNSGLINNILLTADDAATNAANGEKKVYVNPYITIKHGDGSTTVVVADVTNANTEQGFGMSFKDVMMLVDDMMVDTDFNMPESQKESVQEFYDKWADACFSQWEADLPNMNMVILPLPENN